MEEFEVRSMTGSQDAKHTSNLKSEDGLNAYYKQVKRQILMYQSLTTGLFPCDLSNPESQEAHVRDSMYCAISVWALSQAYRRIDNDRGRAYELGQSAVKCMRGILACWMNQADHVESFKVNQSPEFALHSKFHLITGDPLYSHHEYNNLQTDCPSLYLLYITQMTQSGLKVIFTLDEVNFVQNLVFYVERCFQTADYGMWERGTKYNCGETELHASGIGMAKVALEAINGVNMYGDQGAAWSVIYSDIDTLYRTEVTFLTILPQESNSKNTDAALIMALGWPAFACHRQDIVTRAKDRMSTYLEGMHGLKRFQRDGYGTVIEDRSHRHYSAAEIMKFENIECEWPIFLLFHIIDSMFQADEEKTEYYMTAVKPLLKESPDGPIVPKYYYVPEDALEFEREDPGSQERVASDEGQNGNLFLWGQAIYIISQLMVDGLLNANELDPCRRYLPPHDRPTTSTRYISLQRSLSDLVVQMVLITESVRLQNLLETIGIVTQTPHQIEPIQIWPPSELAKAYNQLGGNVKLKLSGRAPRALGWLGIWTAKIYRACGITFMCYPYVFEVSDFYLSQDVEFVIEDIKNELVFLSKSWTHGGRPTYCMIIREDQLKGGHAAIMFDLLAQFKREICANVRIRLGRLQEFVASAMVEHLDFLTIDPDSSITFRTFQEKDTGKDFRNILQVKQQETLDDETEQQQWVEIQDMWRKSIVELAELLQKSDSLYHQAQILEVILKREKLTYMLDGITVQDRLEGLCTTAALKHAWAVVRFCSSLLQKAVDSLVPSIVSILVRGKEVILGQYGQMEFNISKPLTTAEIKAMVYEPFHRDTILPVLLQELILNVGRYSVTNPEMFQGMRSIRFGWIVQAMHTMLRGADRNNPKQTQLYCLSPSKVKKLLLTILERRYKHTEGIYYTIALKSMEFTRSMEGCLNRVPKGFYNQVWNILEKNPFGISVGDAILPQQPTMSNFTNYELKFKLLVEKLMSKVLDPPYRQMIIESVIVVHTILMRLPEATFTDTLDLHHLVQVAYDAYAKDCQKNDNSDCGGEIKSFFDLQPFIQKGTCNYIAESLRRMLQQDSTVTNDMDFQCAMQ